MKYKRTLDAGETFVDNQRTRPRLRELIETSASKVRGPLIELARGSNPAKLDALERSLPIAQILLDDLLSKIRQNVLKEALGSHFTARGIATVDQLCDQPDNFFVGVKGVGRKAVLEINRALQELGTNKSFKSE